MVTSQSNRLLRRPLRRVLWCAVMAFVAEPALAGTPVPTVKVESASGGNSSFELDGTVQALRQATVAAQISGNVLALAVKAGERVKAGQMLARIDDRDASVGLARTEAGVSQADAEWRNARLAAERNRDLRGEGFVSQAAVDQAETQLKAAQAGLQQAQGARSQAALARGFAAVTAPFDGVVLATLLDAGDLASPGRPVATLYAPGAMRAVVQVPASRATVARQATLRQVRLPGEGAWVTPLRSAELPVTDPVAQTTEWRLDLPATAAVLPGQSVTVRFAGATSQAGDRSASLTVPASAVLRRGELEAVYLAQGEHFVLRAVRLGSPRSAAQGAAGIEVLAGLKPGDVVALDAVRAGLADATPASPAR
jgi:RND family efflux transporter MFP subunit